MRVDGASRVLGIFGDPVAHSLSPLMQNAALQQAGIDAVFVPFHVRPEHLAAAVASIRSLDLWGVNVTVPHKERVGTLLDEVDPDVITSYSIHYTKLYDGETLLRRGFVALARLEDFATGVVKPHEKTLSLPKADRFNLLKACRANLSPVFSLYADPCCALEALTRRERERPPRNNFV